MVIAARSKAEFALRALLCSAAWTIAAGSSAASAQASATGQGESAWAERILALHNEQRAQVGSAPLTWDRTLAASAAAYVPQLARSGGLQHSLRSTRPGQGENLWRGTRGAFGIDQIIGTWAGERRLFRPGIFPNVSPSGDGSDVNHYSQMIWQATTRIGCAAHSAGRWDYLVCRYSPRGNVNGQRVP